METATNAIRRLEFEVKTSSAFFTVLLIAGSPPRRLLRCLQGGLGPGRFGSQVRECPKELEARLILYEGCLG